MSNKTKSAKKIATSKTNNTISVRLCIDPDDDFKVNGASFINQDFEFESLSAMRAGIHLFVSNLTWEVHPTKQYKMDDFKHLLGSKLFLDSLAALGSVVGEGTSFEHGVNSFKLGGNQTISVEIY